MPGSRHQKLCCNSASVMHPALSINLALACVARLGHGEAARAPASAGAPSHARPSVSAPNSTLAAGTWSGPCHPKWLPKPPAGAELGGEAPNRSVDRCTAPEDGTAEQPELESWPSCSACAKGKELIGWLARKSLGCVFEFRPRPLTPSIISSEITTSCWGSCTVQIWVRR